MVWVLGFWFWWSERVLVEAVAGLDEVVQLLVGILDHVSVQLHAVVHPKRPWEQQRQTSVTVVLLYFDTEPSITLPVHQPATCSVCVSTCYCFCLFLAVICFSVFITVL